MNFKRHWSVYNIGKLEVQFHLDESESQCLSVARGVAGTRILSAIKNGTRIHTKQTTALLRV